MVAGRHCQVASGCSALRRAPFTLAADEHVHGHLGERLVGVGTGWKRFVVGVQGEPGDVGDDHVAPEGEYVSYLVAEGPPVSGSRRPTK